MGGHRSPVLLLAWLRACAGAPADVERPSDPSLAGHYEHDDDLAKGELDLRADGTFRLWVKLDPSRADEATVTGTWVCTGTIEGADYVDLTVQTQTGWLRCRWQSETDPSGSRNLTHPVADDRVAQPRRIGVRDDVRQYRFTARHRSTSRSQSASW